jgi:ribosomal protein S24E
MEIEIANDSENKTVGRREITFYVLDYAATPTKDLIKTELCKKLNIHPDSTVIVRMDQTFGTKRGTCVAHSYATAEAMKHYEQKHLFERSVIAKKRKEEKAAGKAKQEQSEEKKE